MKRLSSLGSVIFELIKKKARPGRNPKTGEPVVTVSSRRVVTFRAGQKAYERKSY